MTAWILALWSRLPRRLRGILTALGAAVAAGAALFLWGRRRGQAEGAAEAGMKAAREDADRVRDLAAAGDDAGVQRELARATEKAKKATGRKR